MRPRITAELKGVGEKIEANLRAVLKEKGPLTERELWEETLAFFSPELKKYASSLAKAYRTVYGRRIGKKTAQINVIDNIRRILSDIKKRIPHTEKQIVLGRKRYGRIFYLEGMEGRIAGKVREIVRANAGRAKEVLEGVKNGPFRIGPGHRKAAALLEHYGLVEIRKIGGVDHAVEPGTVEADIQKKESRADFPAHFTVYSPFVVSTLIIRNGPEKVRLRFDVAAWDPLNRIFYLGLKREYVGTRDVETFLKKVFLLRVPAKLVILCRSLSDGAKRLAEGWGIEVREII